MNRQEEKKKFDSVKMRLMCGVTAIAVTAGSFACPVNVWADDDDDDILLEDLLDLTDEEVIILSALAEADRRYEAEEQARKQAEAAAQAALAAQRSAEQAARDAQKKLEEERQKKNSKVTYHNRTNLKLQYKNIAPPLK